MKGESGMTTDQTMTGQQATDQPISARDQSTPPAASEQPGWVRALLARYHSGVAHAFILHFGVADYVTPGRTLRPYLAALLARRPIIASYNRAEGITFATPSMREMALATLGLGGAGQADPLLATLASLRPGSTGGEELPRAPGAALPLLERLLLADTPTAVILDYAETLVPAGDMAALAEGDRTALITLQCWGRDPQIAAAGNAIFLITANLADLHPTLRAASSRYEAIELPLPDHAARLSFITTYRQAQGAASTGAGDAPPMGAEVISGAPATGAITWEISSTALAAATAGLSLLHIEDIFLRAAQEGALTRALVQERKGDIIKSEFGEVLDVLEPRFGWERIGGMAHIKRFFDRSVIAPMREGRTARCPMGVLLLGPAGTGKCVAGDSLIVTNRGLVPIAHIPRYWWTDPTSGRVRGLQVLSVTPEGNVALRAASHWLDTGVKETLTITLRRGMRLQGTPEHPVLVLTDGRLVWKKLGDLTVGDVLGLQGTEGCFGHDATLDTETAYVFGLLIGDGNLTTANVVRFTSADHYLLDRITRYMRERYGLSAPARICKGTTELRWHGYQMKHDLLSKGLCFATAHHKEVPWSVFQASKDTQMAFLRGLFDTDGGFSRYTFQYTTASARLAQQVVCLLLNLGLAPQVRQKAHPSKRFSATCIELSGSDIARFMAVIGFDLPRKQEACSAYLVLAKARGRSSNLNLIYSLASLLRSLKEEMHVTWSGAPRLYKLIWGVQRGRNVLRSSVCDLVAWAEERGATGPALAQLRTLLKSGLYFSPVARIEEGQAHVYDLHVPVTHSFVANGIVSHNSAVAEAVAGEAGINFVILNLARILGSYVGVSERNLEKALRAIHSLAPVGVFIDEIDQAISRGGGGDSGVSSRIFKRLLEVMSDTGNRGRVLFLAATNRPDLLDAALRRPGRFDKKIPFLIPDPEERAAIFSVMARAYGLADALIVPPECVARTEGWTGAEIEAAVIKALEVAEDEGLSPSEALAYAQYGAVKLAGQR